MFEVYEASTTLKFYIERFEWIRVWWTNRLKKLVDIRDHCTIMKRVERQIRKVFNIQVFQICSRIQIDVKTSEKNNDWVKVMIEETRIVNENVLSSRSCFVMNVRWNRQSTIKSNLKSKNSNNRTRDLTSVKLFNIKNFKLKNHKDVAQTYTKCQSLNSWIQLRQLFATTRHFLCVWKY